MIVPRSLRLAGRLTAVLVLAATACARPHPPAPPHAEFLVVGGDSTYWVTSGPSGLRVRGAPLMLARYDDRFHELDVADDDHSYANALLVAQLVFSRDLVSGDSVSVFPDTLIDRRIGAYVAAHPDDQPLSPDDPVADHPDVVATSDVTLLDVDGPYLSIEYHADTRQRPRLGYHTTWRSVIDLHARRPLALAELVGSGGAAAIEAEGHRRYDAVVDSAQRSGGDFGDVVRVVLSQMTFDPHSFSLGHLNGKPAVAFAGRIAGRRDGDGTLPLPPIAFDAPAWWGDVRAGLPADTTPTDRRWTARGYSVVAHADTADSIALVSVVDSARRVWRVGAVQAPVRRIYWLDRPPIDSTTRRALDRAFNDATLYDQNARVAAVHATRAGGTVHAAGFHPSAVHAPTARSPRRHQRLP